MFDYQITPSKAVTDDSSIMWPSKTDMMWIILFTLFVGGLISLGMAS